MREELALFGGTPVTREIFPQWPRLAEASLSDALETLRSGRLSYWSGPKGREFESKWASWIGCRQAVSCSSGTLALHLALAGLGIGSGDEVIVPSHSFIASASCVSLAGATPVFCDVAEDHTLDPRRIAPLVTARTRAIVIVHLYGIVCDMGRILETARAHGLAVIEDCAQCAGGEYRGAKTGVLGDAGCFSFHESKHVTTGGEGGMVVTDNEDLAWECRSLRDYGADVREWYRADADAREPAAHVRPGFNCRLAEAQSAIGIAELARLDSWNLPRRRGYAKTYDHAFSQLYGVRGLPLDTPERRNAYWRYPLQFDPEKLACGGDELRRALTAEGIPAGGAQWREAYEEPLFAGKGRCATAEALRDRTLALYLHPTWERSHIELCIAGVKKVLRAYKR